MFREFLLFGKGKEAVAFDANDEGRLLDEGEGVVEGRGAAAGDVVGVEFAGDGDVAVCVEPADEFVCLIAEVGLGGKVGWAGTFDGAEGVGWGGGDTGGDD